MEEEILLFFSVAQSFPFYLFNGGGTSSRLPIGCVLIQSQPEEGGCFFLEKENINFYFIFIFNLLFCWKKKPHSRRAATHLAFVPLSWTFAVYL